MEYHQVEQHEMIEACGETARYLKPYQLVSRHARPGGWLCTHCTAPLLCAASLLGVVAVLLQILQLFERCGLSVLQTFMFISSSPSALAVSHTSTVPLQPQPSPHPTHPPGGHQLPHAALPLQGQRRHPGRRDGPR